MPEKVFVLPASSLWDRVPYVEKGLITEGIDELTMLVTRCGSFIDRPKAEDDPAYKQIIPYAVIRHSERYFLLQRKSTQSEQRLHNRSSIGVGGHINPLEGAPESDVIGGCLTREINEELFIAPGYRETLIGLINDDTTEVGRVHLGVLFEINSASEVNVRESHKMDGGWVNVEDLAQVYERLETWSQIVCDSCLFLRSPLSFHNAATA